MDKLREPDQFFLKEKSVCKDAEIEEKDSKKESGAPSNQTNDGEGESFFFYDRPYARVRTIGVERGEIWPK